MNRYFVCLTISRRQISFEYHQEGASKPLAPFPGEETWPAPLSLYCTPSKIEIGQAAERAAAHGVQGAFKEWFKYLSSAQTVSYLGQQQPISHLLMFAAEEQFRRFLKEVRYNMDGGLENCRASMPLVLSFEDDVDDSMRIFLVNLFRNMGYGRILETYNNRYIASYYGKICTRRHVLIVDSDDVDLTLSLISQGKEEEPVKQVIPNAGTDPRLQSVCNMIWDKTGAEYCFLDRNTEQPYLEQVAREVINANQTEFEGVMNYSTGERLSFLVTRSELVAAGSGTRSVAADVVGFIRQTAGVLPTDVMVVLRNFAARSDYFSQSLGSEFSLLKIYDENAAEEVGRLIVARVMSWLTSNEEHNTGGSALDNNGPLPTDILKEKTRKWRLVKAEAGGKSRGGQKEQALSILKVFLSECESVSGLDALISEIRSEIDKIQQPDEGTDTPSAPVDSNEIKRLTRKWREVRAVSKSKINSGHGSDAIVELTSFREMVAKVAGTKDLLESIDLEISTLRDKESDEGSKRPSAESPTGSRAARAARVGKVEPVSKPAGESEGKSLVSQGKLKEARQWYRDRNDSTMARILTDIIRMQKGIDNRKSGLEEYRRTRNKDQIARIIKEIQEFIELCDKAGVDSGEYRKLLAEYRRI